jgi:ABC-type phosphate transport system substrate-binding protein
MVIFAPAISVTTAGAENPNDILVIANLGIKTDSITIDDLKDVYLKKRTNWSSGEKVIPIHVSNNSALRDAFRSAVLKMSSTDEQSYWQVRKIKEGDTDPPSFDNVMKAVFRLHGAVSYVFRSQYKSNVAKIVLVLPAGK